MFAIKGFYRKEYRFYPLAYKFLAVFSGINGICSRAYGTGATSKLIRFFLFCLDKAIFKWESVKKIFYGDQEAFYKKK